MDAAIKENDFSPGRFGEYAAALRQGIENMRKLIYAFYEPGFSFKQVIDKHPEVAARLKALAEAHRKKFFARGRNKK